MDPNRTIAHLTVLSRFEIDVIKAFSQAVEHLQEPVLRDEVYRMKADAERHVLEMSDVLRAFGAEPPAFERDLKGYVMACLTAIRSASGTDGSVRAVGAIVLAAIERYEDALGWEEPVELRAMLQANLADYQRHVDAISTETHAVFPAR